MEGKELVTFTATFCKPDSEYRMYKNKVEIFHGEKFHFERNEDVYTLEINEIKPEDNGKYILECGKGPTRTAAWLYVEGSVKFILQNM